MKITYINGCKVPVSIEGILESMRFVLHRAATVTYGQGESAIDAFGDGQCAVFVVRAGMPDFDAKECSLFMRAAFNKYIEARYGGILASEYGQAVDLNEHVAKSLAPKPPSAN